MVSCFFCFSSFFPPCTDCFLFPHPSPCNLFYSDTAMLHCFLVIDFNLKFILQTNSAGYMKTWTLSGKNMLVVLFFFNLILINTIRKTSQVLLTHTSHLLLRVHLTTVSPDCSHLKPGETEPARCVELRMLQVAILQMVLKKRLETVIF